MRRVQLALLALTVILVSFSPAPASSYEACFQQASRYYGVGVGLLRAIADVESGMNPYAVNKNANGSEDIGLMQINSSWLPRLKEYGISRSDLFNGCVSIHVGAWILSQNMLQFGRTWRAIGAYNAKSEEKRIQYVRKVAAKMSNGALYGGTRGKKFKLVVVSGERNTRQNDG